jgi:hypothetical protein
MTNDEPNKEKQEREIRAKVRALLTEAAGLTCDKLREGACGFIREAAETWNFELEPGDDEFITSATLREIIDNWPDDAVEDGKAI